MAYDPDTQTVILFGGDDGQNALRDTWSWDGSRWSRLYPAVSPPSGTRALMAYDPGTHRLVLTGGYAMSGGDQSGSVDGGTAPATFDFVNADDGWATTTAPSGAAVPVLLQTTDGGVTWTPFPPQVTGSPASS